MIQSGSRDFGPMLGAILRVAIFYAIGAASAFIYAKIMVYVTQGTMRDLRCQIFEHMESLPIKYFDIKLNFLDITLISNYCQI